MTFIFQYSNFFQKSFSYWKKYTYNYSWNFFFILISVSSVKPKWQRILQDEGKGLSVSWKFNTNESLLNCLVNDHQSNFVAGMKSKFGVNSKRDDTTLLYGTDISFLIQPFNSSIHLGKYQLQINTTNGKDIFHYDVDFELFLKSAENMEAGKFLLNFLLRSWKSFSRYFECAQ